MRDSDCQMYKEWKKWAGRVATVRKCKAWNMDKIREVEYRRQAEFEISNLLIKVKENARRAG
jgi:hypothetical protein